MIGETTNGKRMPYLDGQGAKAMAFQIPGDGLGESRGELCTPE